MEPQVGGGRQRSSGWTFLDDCQGLSHNGCPWKLQGKGCPSFSILKRTPRSQADLPVSGLAGMSWFEGFQLLLNRIALKQNGPSPRVTSRLHAPLRAGAGQAWTAPRVPTNRPLPPRATGWRCRRALGTRHVLPPALSRAGWGGAAGCRRCFPAGTSLWLIRL